MSEKRFRITTNPKSQSVVFDEKQKKHHIGSELEDLLNEQDEKIKKLEKELNDCEKFRYAVFKRMMEMNDE